MIYKKYISNYISNYTYNCIFIVICILLLFIISNYLFRKNNNEDFNSISEYPIKYIEDDCNIYLKSDLKGKHQDFCKNSAFVKDGKLLKNLCQENGAFQILDLEIEQNKKQFYGCGLNQNNILGLKWENPNIGNIPHQLYSVPSIFYDLYFNNNPYKGTWEYKDTIGQINSDGSNFFQVKKNTSLGTWSSLNMKNTNNYSISFWLSATNNSTNRNILQISVDGKDCLYQQCTENFSDFWSDLRGLWGKYNNLIKEKITPSSPPQPPPRFLLNQQRQPMISIVNNKMQITSGTTNNNNNNKTWNFPSFNNFNGLSHIIYNFKETSIDTYLNGELLQTFHMGEQIMPTPEEAQVFISNQYQDPSGILIKNMMFWDINFNKIYANKLYNSYLPLIREVNKIKIMGKKQNSDEQSFKTPFKLNKRLTLGRYKDLNLISYNSITISFTINVKKNYSEGVNIMLITTDKFNWQSRNPGIWLYPNKCALNICRSTDYNWNEEINYLPFDMNQDVYFKIVFDADSKKIIVYKNNNWKSPIIHQCKGNFNYITGDYRVWLAANSLGENVEVSNFEIEGGVFTPKII